MLYLSLLRNQWRQRTRTLSARYRWLALLTLLLLGTYLTFMLLGSGLFWGEVVAQLSPGAAPIPYLNSHLLGLFLTLFMVRFFLQKSPHAKMQPYLHLPIPRQHLIRYFQTASLVSPHNLFPFLFILPCWLRFVRPEYGSTGAWLWLGGVTLMFLISTYANNLLRAVLAGGRRSLLIAGGAFLALIVLDRLAGPRLLNDLSLGLFGALLEGNLPMLLLLTILTLMVYVLTNRLLRHRLLESGEGRRRWRAPWKLSFAQARDHTANLIFLEMKLIWRNRRPRTYFFISIFFGTVYTAVLLTTDALVESSFLSSFAGLCASGIFALNYGQLMFAWESAYFDGTLVRDLRFHELVRAKLLLLQGSCVAFFLLSLPLFYVLAPNLVGLHLAFLFYNVGITSVLMMALAVANQKRVDLSKGGGFLNYEGFSIVHWLWFIPTLVPPMLLLMVLPSQEIAWLLVGAAGLLSLLMVEPWSRFFARQLLRRRYLMAAGFRTHD